MLTESAWRPGLLASPCHLVAALASHTSTGLSECAHTDPFLVLRPPQPPPSLPTHSPTLRMSHPSSILCM
uniref:Putative secreted protein n=1 Tax=Rhipicephalus microplus TaxID=6941 RepID=A0A6G5A1M6_RHIMP